MTLYQTNATICRFISAVQRVVLWKELNIYEKPLYCDAFALLK